MKKMDISKYWARLAKYGMISLHVPIIGVHNKMKGETCQTYAVETAEMWVSALPQVQNALVKTNAPGLAYATENMLRIEL
jgi:hypothetical protein